MNDRQLESDAVCRTVCFLLQKTKSKDLGTVDNLLHDLTKKIRYAMHKLLTESLLSIPDILRIEWFEVESQITSQYTKSPE